MRYLDSLLEYSELLGEIFQGRNSYSLGTGSTEAEKRKAVGQYLGKSTPVLGETSWSWVHRDVFPSFLMCDSACGGCPQSEHGAQS